MGQPRRTRIVAIGDLPDTKAIRKLQRLDWDGALEFIRVPPKFRYFGDILQFLAEPFTAFDAVICRPARSGRLEVMANTDRKPVIATLSTGTDHINAPGAEVISARGLNASGVAELAIWEAIELLRYLPDAKSQMRRGNLDSRPFEKARELEGLTWVTYGCGPQVVQLLGRLFGFGLRQLIVCRDGIDPARFARFLGEVENEWKPRGLRVDTMSSGEMMEFRLGDLHVIGASSLEEVVGMADIVTIHAKLNDKTRFRFNRQLLSTMRPEAILVNLARGDIVVEADLVSAIKAGRLGGYGADVINSKAEHSGDPDDSVLWQHCVGATNSSLPIVLTPHIGGTTTQGLERVSEKVVYELLARLGIIDSDTTNEQ